MKNLSAKQKNWTRFWILVATYFSLQFIQQFNWLTGSGMWAENATVYFSTAMDGFQPRDLFVTDSGYLPSILHVVAALLNLLPLSPQSFAILYNWVGLIIAFLPVAVFQHLAFRSVLRSDTARSLLIAVTLMFQADWGTSNFLNSSYSLVFYLLVLSLWCINTTLAGEPRPPGMKFIAMLIIAPLAVLSKPAALALIPIYVFLLIRAKGLVRLISAFVLLAGVIQLITIAISRFGNGVLPQTRELDPWSQMFDAFHYVSAFPFRFVVGPIFTDLILGEWWEQFPYSSLCGIGILIVAILLAVKSHDLQAKVLVFTGIGFLVSAAVFNSFTLWDVWNPSNYPYDSVPLHTRSLTMYLATLFLLAGAVKGGWTLASALQMDRPAGLHQQMKVFSISLAAWIIFSGWGAYVAIVSREPSWPVIGTSSWVQNWDETRSAANGNGCIPLDPWAWGAFGEGCLVAAWTNPEHFQHSQRKTGFAPISALDNHDSSLLRGVAIAVSSIQSGRYRFEVTITTSNGQVGAKLIGNRNVASAGANTLFVEVVSAIKASEVSGVHVRIFGSGFSLFSNRALGSEILSYLVIQEPKRTGE